MNMAYRKVLFGQSYFLRFDAKLWDAMQPYPPLGTLYAAGYIREQGYPVALFDAILAESEQDWQKALEQESPYYAVLYEDNFNYLSKMCLARMREAAFSMIAMAKAHGCSVIICGSDATDHYDRYLEAGADYVIIGEGEETLAELLQALEANKETSHIIGVTSQANNTPTRRPVMKALDELPLPAWDLINIAQYREIWLKNHGYFSMNLVTTRGCPYHCNWCAKPIWGQRYNVHSPHRVAEMVAHLDTHYQVNHIWFADDIMGLKPGWFEGFAEAVEAKDIKKPFKCLSRADLLLRGDTIKALKRAGCDIVWVGAESGSQKILDAMEKGTRVEEIREVAHKLRETGVRVGFFLQFGYPGETREDIEQTLQLVRDCMPDDIGISVSYPLPGTKFYDRVKDQLGEQQHWQDSSDLAMLYQGPFTTEFYRQLHTVVHKEFRSRRTAKALGSSPVGARDVLAMAYHQATLPLARQKLNRLAQIPQTGFIALEAAMNYQEASKPTPQTDE